MLKRSVQIIVALWLITWGVLQVRLWVKDPRRVEKFFELIVSSDENRRSMVYGKEWHQFFNFCKEHLPSNSRYQIVGIPLASIHRARLLYNLYPRLLSNDPEFLVVYKKSDCRKSRHRLKASLGEDICIVDLREKDSAK